MWIFLNDAFVSIVAHRDKPGVLCCRARFEGDLQRAFRGHLRGRRVKFTPGADYAYRVELAREVVGSAISSHVLGIDYPNFKGSVRDRRRHDVYMRVWDVMKDEQDRLLFPARKHGARMPPRELSYSAPKYPDFDII